MKKLIIIDFDHTIINTSHLTEAIAKMLEDKFGVSKEEFLQAREEVKKCCLVEDIDTVIDHLSYKNKEELHTAFHDTIKDTVKDFVFDDVIDFIERHHKAGFDIVISTHGDKELQAEKIKHSGIPDYVAPAISTKEKSDVVAKYLKKYDKIYFIDDKAQNIDKVKTAYEQVETYFLTRPQDCKYCHIQSVCACNDHTVEDLNFDIK